MWRRRQLIAELDRVFAEFGGMKPLMRLFFQRYNHSVVTTEEFWNFLNVMTGMNVDEYFQRYTLGQGCDRRHQGTFADATSDKAASREPARLTKKEVEAIR